MQRFVLLSSISLIAAYWTFLGLSSSLAAPVGAIAGVREIALYTCTVAVGASAAIAALLRGSGERFTDLGFSPARDTPGRGRHPVVTVALAAGAGFALSLVVFEPPPADSVDEASVFTALALEPYGPFWLVVLAVVGGGYLEELLRAFCLTRFERVFGKVGLVSAVAVDSLVFGLGHRYQGDGAIAVTAVLGLGFAGIFLWRRRVIDAMIAHGVWDLIGVLAISAAAHTG
jgi:membrane protease YdiL (CAAX protease family)